MNNVKAETILYNGNIHTLDPHNPLASAVAIKDDKFIAVGEDKNYSISQRMV